MKYSEELILNQRELNFGGIKRRCYLISKRPGTLLFPHIFPRKVHAICPAPIVVYRKEREAIGLNLRQ